MSSIYEQIGGAAAVERAVDIFYRKMLIDERVAAYFDDVTDGNDPRSAHCIAHVRPFAELQADLDADTVANYNFITPNICNDISRWIHILLV